MGWNAEVQFLRDKGKVVVEYKAMNGMFSDEEIHLKLEDGWPPNNSVDIYAITQGE